MSRINYARLTINTNNLSDDIISSIKRNKSLSIYSGVQKNVLIDLVKIIKNINGFKLVIILEDSNLINNSINGLDILEFLPSINHLHILVHQTTPLLNIDALEYVDNLRTFSVSGNLNKNIDFSPLRKFVRLSSLHINDLIFSDKNWAFVLTIWPVRISVPTAIISAFIEPPTLLFAIDFILSQKILKKLIFISGNKKSCQVPWHTCQHAVENFKNIVCYG